MRLFVAYSDDQKTEQKPKLMAKEVPLLKSEEKSKIGLDEYINNFIDSIDSYFGTLGMRTQHYIAAFKLMAGHIADCIIFFSQKLQIIIESGLYFYFFLD